MYWYLVHTKPKQEKCALQNLQWQGYRCYLPMLSVEKLHQGSLTVVDEPLFPRYLFIQVRQGDSTRSWASIRSTRGVNRLVYFGSEPARIDDNLIDLLRMQEAFFQHKTERLFKPGERVCLTEDAFAGIEGIYQMAEGERRVMVLIELLSKPVTLQVSPTNLHQTN